MRLQKYIAEGIRFDTSKYEASHGKKPKGVGSWAFEVKGKTVFTKGSKSFADAKKEMMVKYGNDKSIFSINVMP